MSEAADPPPEPAAEPFSGWTGDPAPTMQRRADGAFAAAWVVAAASLVIGAALYWAGISTGSFYGQSTAADQALQTVSWLLAPSLVQAGLLGLVVMLVWTGVRHARAGDVARLADALTSPVEGRR
ncbi:hypothetical protein ASE14_13590 [Agromyces sp. Root81]|nr:hypothetical protein ASE14_13590 [Agromyces sp. Root81]